MGRAPCSMNPLLDVHGYPPDQMVINPYAFVSGGFMPPDIAGCVLWLDATQITGLSDGDPVTQWDDQSGQGNNAETSPVQQSVRYETNAIGSLPAVNFHNDGGTRGSMQFPDLGLSEMSLFIVVQASGSGERVLIGGNATLSYMIGCPWGGTGFQLFLDAGGASGGTITDLNLLSTVTGASSTALRINGALIGTGGDTSLSGVPIYIGAFWAGAAALLANIGELIIYDSALDSTNRDLVEAYLATKWGITI